MLAAASLGFACGTANVPPPVDVAPPPDAALPPAEVAQPAGAPTAASPPDRDAPVVEAKGWSWLVDRLVADGVDRARADRAFADPRVAPFDGLYFSLRPAEPRSLYRGVLQRRSVALARACALEYAPAFRAAEAKTGVPASVLAAILHVETRCGRNTGRSVVLYGLARLAMASEPRNLEENLARYALPDGSVDPLQELRVRERAAELDALFYPEVRAVFTLADLLGEDPLDLRGSASGAFGAPQFLPTTYLRYGSDGNGDGRVDIDDVEDAALSAGRYLAASGWHPGLTPGERRRVIWHYNRSDAYVDAVLRLANVLDGSIRRSYAQTRVPRPGMGSVPVEAAQ